MAVKKNIFNAFKPASLEDWEAAASRELNGAKPMEELVHQARDWAILPYYNRKTSLSYAPLLKVSENEFLGARAWHNCPRLIVEEAKETNQKALEYLREGADGILFEINDETNFEILLNDIEWQFCSLNFLVKKNQDAIASALLDFIAVKKISHNHIHGAFFGDIAPSRQIQSHFRLVGYQMKSAASPVNEIVNGFNSMLASTKGDFHGKAGLVAFSVGVGTDFFLEVAKLRAIRMLWNRFLAAKSKVNTPLFIHAHSMRWTDKNYQPHGNMLKGANAAMAAILGGCDALTIDPEDDDQAMMIRVARNISNILREESHFSKVADPMAGSYFIEDLTEQLTSAAWKSIHH